MELRPFSNGIVLSQTKYIQDLLARKKMLDNSPIATPMVLEEKETSTDTNHIDITNYRSIFGVLQYLTIT